MLYYVVSYHAIVYSVMLYHVIIYYRGAADARRAEPGSGNSGVAPWFGAAHVDRASLDCLLDREILELGPSRLGGEFFTRTKARSGTSRACGSPLASEQNRKPYLAPGHMGTV